VAAADPASASVGAAFELALTAHGGQTDRAGQLYIGHVARVTARMTEDADRIVALLHDTVEDTDVTLERIRETFGDSTARSVDCLTHRPEESVESYMARVNTDACARRVKQADLDDNADPRRLLMLDDKTRDRLLQKYANMQALLRTDDAGQDA
jgi:(p)ppGpp synthase/HD superfamily hydrolase